MIVYVPTPITSVEQAEQLPARTVAQHPEERPILRHHGRWRGRMTVITDAEVVADGRWEALVPVEAEEETTVPFQAPVAVMHVGFGSGAFDAPHARLVTPWEES